MDGLKNAYWIVLVVYFLVQLAAAIQRVRKKPWKGLMVLAGLLLIGALVLLTVRLSTD